MRKIFLTAALILCALSCIYAQSDNSSTKRVFNVKHKPTFVDNYSYKVFFLSNGIVYNLMDFKLSDKAKNISQMAIQPGGANCAMLIKRPQQSKVEVYDTETTNKLIVSIDNDSNPIAFNYSPDGKTLAIGNEKNLVEFYDTKTHTQYRTINTGIVPNYIALSENNYYLAVSNGSSVEIWNLQLNSLRTTISSDAEITSITFSPDNSMFAVTSFNGNVKIYDTRSFNKAPLYSFEGMGNAKSAHFHPGNKYLGVVKDDKTILLQNVHNPNDVHEIISYNGGISNIRFITDINNLDKEFALYSSKAGITMQQLSDLNPNYGQLLSERVSERMDEWMKMMEGESLEEYRIRVNEETRAQQMIIFENEIATEMAGDLIAAETITLGGFNTEKNLLTLDFGGMPSIALDVPQDELSSFSNTGNLKFENTIYGLNDKDEFEIIYTDVINVETGKIYTYNNLDRKPITFDDNFVPFEVIDQANMEQVKLERIKNSVVETAKTGKLISDNTHIDVNTQVLSDVDANGNRILNYKIDYKYQVDKKFSAREDFPSGKYIITESNAAMSMLAIIKEAFASADFAQYIKPGKTVRIKINGSADAAPILNRINYNGCYGDFTNELIYKNGQLSNISVSKASGIKENDQLAFLRAMGVKDYIVNNISELNKMHCDYQYNVELANKTGGEYRRISVEFVFIDAIQK